MQNPIPDNALKLNSMQDVYGIDELMAELTKVFDTRI